MGATAAKLLVYYHPDSTATLVQERLVADVADECRRLDLPLFLEPITYSVDPSGPSLTGEDRRRVVIDTARRLTAIGGDVLKVEFPYDASVTDEGRWADACAELDDGLAGALGPALRRRRRRDLRAPGRGRLPGRRERRARRPVGLGRGGPPDRGWTGSGSSRPKAVERLTAARLDDRGPRPTLARPLAGAPRRAAVGADWYRDYPEA